MKVKIYKPTKNAMQSGKANTKKWLVEFYQDKTRFIEPVMGWTGNTDTKPQIHLSFDNEDEAIEYAKRNGLEYTVVQPEVAKVKIQAYADNFTGNGN
jgi:hypothetical protein